MNFRDYQICLWGEYYIDFVVYIENAIAAMVILSQYCDAIQFGRVK